MLDRKFWGKYFKVYNVLNLVIPYQELLSELEKELDLKSNDTVLDVGSGTGNLMMKIKDKCKRVVGIDYSEEGINIHKLKDPAAEIVLYDINKKFPFPENYFSKIICNNTLYTLTENQQLKVLAEIYRVVQPGGKFVISNIKKNYSSFQIYLTHISESIKRQGFFKTSYSIVRMLVPALKMLYYNNKIKKNGVADYHFLGVKEQKEILKRVGFKNISDTKYVYAGQAIMNTGYKSQSAKL